MDIFAYLIMDQDHKIDKIIKAISPQQLQTILGI